MAATLPGMASLLKKVLHQSGSRTPQDLVARLSLALDKVSEASTEKQQEDAAKLLHQMKVRFLRKVYAPYFAISEQWCVQRGLLCLAGLFV